MRPSPSAGSRLPGRVRSPTSHVARLRGYSWTISPLRRRQIFASGRRWWASSQKLNPPPGKSRQMRLHLNKPGIRALGVAESFKEGDLKSRLAGVVMRSGLVIDGFVLGAATLGGDDATGSGG